MENSGKRVGAKIVAIVDLVVMIGLLIGMFVGTIVAAVAILTPAEEDGGGANVIGFATLWLLVAAKGLSLGVQLWAAFKLLRSTEIGRDPNEALDNARFWRIVNIAYLAPVIPLCGWLVLFSVYLAVNVSMWFFLVTLLSVFYVLWRGGAIFICSVFVKELEGRVSVPISVITKQ